MARSVLIGARLWGKGTPSLGNEQLVLLSLKWTFLAKRISVEGCHPVHQNLALLLISLARTPACVRAHIRVSRARHVRA